MKGTVKNQQGKRNNKKSYIGPSHVKKEKAQEKRSSRPRKSIRAYIAWENNNTSSSSSSHEEVEANMCLMIGQKSKVSLTSKK